MNIFSEDNKQKVLKNLHDIAIENKSTSVPAIKLYLDLAEEQSPSESLTVEHAFEILRQAMPVENTEEQ